MAQSVALQTKSRGCKFETQLGQITAMEIDNEIISMIILQLPLFQEGHTSVTGESICIGTVLPLRGLSLSMERVNRLSDRSAWL